MQMINLLLSAMNQMKQFPLSALTIQIAVLLSLTHHANCQLLFDENGQKCPETMPNFCACDFARVTCNCNSDDEMIINAVFSQRIEIAVSGCKRVSIQQGSFKNSNNLSLTLRDIRDIRLMHGSFDRDVHTDIRINITLLGSTISEIPSGVFSISGTPNTNQPAVVPKLALQIINSDVGKIAQGALGNFTVQTLSFINTTFDLLETRTVDNSFSGTIRLVNNTFRRLDHQAFILHNASHSTNLELIGNIFIDPMPQFLVGSLSDETYIMNNTFPQLNTSPWNLRVDGHVKLGNNIFANIPTNGIHIAASGQIHLDSNDIHHLQARALQLIVPIGKKAVIFLESNILRRHDPYSLCLHDTFTARQVVIKHTLFEQQCRCNVTKDIAQALGVANVTLDTLYGNGIHEQWFRGGECLVGDQRLTNTARLPSRRVAIDQFLVHSCLGSKNLQMVLLIVFAIILITIAVCVILAWRRVKYRTTVGPSGSADFHSYTEPAPSTVGQPWLMVQPDPRTYQETEIHILFDKAEELDTPQDEILASYSRGRGDGSEGDHRNEEMMGKDKILRGTENKSYEVNEKGERVTNPQVRQSCPPLSLSK
ncbi:hypothetical protein Pmani_028927 [Petrolisthes manimaculis]|uniref:Uncharacterized protein n=1 Tax=Petrolisthes manimaculis TaxID=1843537 RepID=A0AAE1P192_9EUCA|nr:hypothetical protein Pmani_028927 [Petrolisthes manimaculis]